MKKDGQKISLIKLIKNQPFKLNSPNSALPWPSIKRVAAQFHNSVFWRDALSDGKIGLREYYQFWLDFFDVLQGRSSAVLPNTCPRFDPPAKHQDWSQPFSKVTVHSASFSYHLLDQELNTDL